MCVYIYIGFPGSSDGKESAYSAEGPGSIPGLGSSTGGGHDNPLEYSAWKNPMDGRAWWAWQAIVHGISKSRTRLSN